MHPIIPNVPVHEFRNTSMRIRRPFGYRPYGFGFGFPLLGGFLGGLAAGALIRPPYYPYYPYPPYPPYPYYGGVWY